MMHELRYRVRNDLEVGGDGYLDLFSGARTDAAEAAAQCFADVMHLVWQYFTRKE